jgi:hypothetical protein
MKPSASTVQREQISRLAFIPAIVSLLPIIGIPFGISALLWGIANRKIGGRKIITLAGVGLVISLVFALVTFFYYNKLLSNPSLVDIKTRYSQEGLAFVVRFLEFYKSGHGQYPSSLENLREEGDVYPTQRVLADPFYLWFNLYWNAREATILLFC